MGAKAFPGMLPMGMYGAQHPLPCPVRHATLPGAQHAAHGHELPSGILTYLFPAQLPSKIPAWTTSYLARQIAQSGGG